MFRKSGTLDDWRDYFRTSKSDIFDTIEYAILVAASDCPQEFRLRRDRIAEILFSCKFSRCVGCDRVELSVGGDGEGGGVSKSGGCEFEGGVGCKGESKGNSSRVDQVNNYSYGDAEALTDEIEEESQILSEVLRIKKIFENYQDESDTDIIDSLRRLQLMSLAANVLKSTEIGKSVNGLRKSESKQIRHLARTLIEGWKDIIDEWADTTALLSADATPESANPSVLEEDDGLDFPPLDEAALLAAQTSVELSQFFDGMDDDGNPQNSREFNNNLDSSRNLSTLTSQATVRSRKQQEEATHEPYIPAEITHEPYIPTMVNMDSEPDYFMKNHVTPVMQSHKPKSGPGGSGKANVDRNVSNSNGKFQKKPFESSKQKKQPMASQQDHCQNNSPVTASLEVAKRKLQERYQEAENVKRQRTIQVMELNELPSKKKQQQQPQRHKANNNAHKNGQQMRPGNNGGSRHWANGRR